MRHGRSVTDRADLQLPPVKQRIDPELGGYAPFVAFFGVLVVVLAGLAVVELYRGRVPYGIAALLVACGGAYGTVSYARSGMRFGQAEYLLPPEVLDSAPASIDLDCDLVTVVMADGQKFSRVFIRLGYVLRVGERWLRLGRWNVPFTVSQVAAIEDERLPGHAPPEPRA